MPKARDFQGNAWGHQGPNMFSKIAREMCTKPTGDVGAQFLSPNWTCPEMEILPMKSANAVPYMVWDRFFDSKSAKDVSGAIKVKLSYQSIVCINFYVEEGC